MKKLICIALCVLMVMALVACQESGAVSQRTEETLAANCPVQGLSWAMTLEEVKAWLLQNGLSEDEIVFNDFGGNAHKQILLSAEQCATLKINPIPNCPISTEGPVAVTFFFRDDNGQLQLSYMYVDVTAESMEMVSTELTKLYGEGTNDTMWSTPEMLIRISQGGSNTEITVDYRANPKAG